MVLLVPALQCWGEVPKLGDAERGLYSPPGFLPAAFSLPCRSYWPNPTYPKGCPPARPSQGQTDLGFGLTQLGLLLLGQALRGSQTDPHP